MTGELRIVLACIVLGALGLIVGVVTFGRVFPAFFAGREGYAAAITIALLVSFPGIVLDLPRLASGG